MLRIENHDIVLQEMESDLGYRLRRCREFFRHCVPLVRKAVAVADYPARSNALRALGDCSLALQLIYSDLCLIMDGSGIAFPRDFADWTWELPGADERFSRYFEQLQGTARDMENLLKKQAENREVEE